MNIETMTFLEWAVITGSVVFFAYAIYALAKEESDKNKSDKKN